MSTRVHDFEERLRWGERAGDEPFWETVYRKAFPSFVSCARNVVACEEDVRPAW